MTKVENNIGSLISGNKSIIKVFDKGLGHLPCDVVCIAIRVIVEEVGMKCI